MKKIFFTLGATAISALPIAAVIGCSQTTDKKIVLKDTNIKVAKAKNEFTKNLMINGKEITTDHDMAIMSTDFYKGRLSGMNENGWAEVGKDRASSFSQSDSVMLGKGDSIIYVFDNDNNDGLSVSNFAITHFLEDTSLMSSIVNNYYSHQPEVMKIKTNYGAKVLLPFIKTSDSSGLLMPWIGSQSNHSTLNWDESMKLAKEKYPTNVYSKLVEYYKSASKGFVPTITEDDLVSYKRIAKNAIEVTFNPEANFTLTAALLHAIPEGLNKEQKTGKMNIGPLSVGGVNEWSAYQLHHQKTVASKYTSDDSKGTLIK